MSQKFEDFANSFKLPDSPKEAHAFYVALASQYRMLLAEAPPHKFVIALCIDKPEPYFLAYSGSFGYYRGTLLHAVQFTPPIAVNLAQLGLNPEFIKTFDLMLYRLAAIKCIEWTNNLIKQIEEAFPNDV